MLKITFFIIALFIFFCGQAFAATDPRLAPNNKVGINVLSPDAQMQDVSSLVNTNGDWGWMVITVTKNERNTEELQAILNQANQDHVIPIIRLATEFDAKNGYWKRPEDSDAKDWTDFLSKLYFPTQNKYIQIYNEVNRAQEWGGKVDASDYAHVLSNTIDELKAKSDNFFVLNAPLDLSLTNSSDSQDAASYFDGMQNAASGIFSKIDGWASHSYPNPDFSASPYESGRTKINGYIWELAQISKYTDKDLPVFITETGWKRTDGGSGLSEDRIAQYYKDAFSSVWNDSRVVAVAPFVLSYPESLFNQFSFENSSQNSYYKYFSAIQNLQKVSGEPERKNILSNFQIDKTIALNNIGNTINLKFQNTGNYIWNTGKDMSIQISGQEILATKVTFNKAEVYPGDSVTASINLESTTQGKIPLTINVVDGNQVLDQKEIIIINETSISSLSAKTKSASAVLGVSTVNKKLL